MTSGHPKIYTTLTDVTYYAHVARKGFVLAFVL